MSKYETLLTEFAAIVLEERVIVLSREVASVNEKLEAAENKTKKTI